MKDTGAGRVPLSLAFEGQSWLLTTLLHTTIAIWSVLKLQDRDEPVLSMYFEFDDWTNELMLYLMSMVLATIGGILAVGVLSLNLRPVEEGDWRSRSCRAVLALVLIDIKALYTVHFAMRMLTREKQTVSTPASMFIVAVGIVLTIAFNLMFIRLYGCCICCCLGENANAKLVQHSQKCDSKSSIAIDCITCSSAKDTEETKGTGLHVEPEDVIQTTPPSQEATSSGTIPESMEAENKHEIDFRDTRDSEAQVETGQQPDTGKQPITIARLPRSAFQVGAPDHPPPLSSLRRWDTQKLIEVGSVKVSTGRQTRSYTSGNTSDIIIDADKEVATQKRCKRAEGAPDVNCIVSRFLRRAETSASMKLSQWSPYNIWNSVREEPGRFRYAVWVKSAFLSSVIILIFTSIQSISVFKYLSDLYKENRDRFNSNSDEFNSFLTNAGWENGTDSIVGTVVAELFFVVDAVILDLKHTVGVSYLLGSMVGLSSLVAVLIQHKRISLAVSDGLKDFRSVASGHQESPWTEFQKKYPILGACFFLAILSSTAVVQLHIVGMTVSILLGLAINVTRLSVLVDMFGYYILAYLLVFAIDLVIMHFLRARLISPDGTQINHPRWFNFITLVLSMVHLVIGMLYALWRVFYLLVTTIFVLNRLDICLFTTGKSLDNGHNAFMSMLVLTVLIQEDHESFVAESIDKQTALEKLETA